MEEKRAAKADLVTCTYNRAHYLKEALEFPQAAKHFFLYLAASYCFLRSLVK